MIWSSAGKSTLAKALRELISNEERRFEVVSIDDLTEELSSCPIRPVRIVCPLEILKCRELARGDRCIGSAEASAKYLFPKEGHGVYLR